MSDTTGAGGAPVGIANVRIIQDVPVIFSDGVVSHFFGPGVSKFYLGRFDPDPDAKGPPNLANVLQVVMTTEGFAQMVMFLQHRLQIMIRDGMITQERLDEIIKTTTWPSDASQSTQ
jgi:hypothetical protein